MRILLEQVTGKYMRCRGVNLGYYNFLPLQENPKVMHVLLFMTTKNNLYAKSTATKRIFNLTESPYINIFEL